MNTVFPLLRKVDKEPLRLQHLQRQLRKYGVDSILQPVPVLPCLRFELLSPSAQMIGRVQAHDWAAQHLPGLEGLDWLRMDPDQLAGLCTVEKPLRWDIPALDYQQSYFLGLALAGDDAPPHPQVYSLEGPVWLERFDGKWTGPPAPIEVSGEARLPVRLQLGNVRQPIRRLLHLRPNDILLLPFARPQAWRANRCLFEFDIHSETLTVKTLYSTDADQPTHDVVMQGERPYESLDLASLPLTLDVVLCTLRLSLAELADLGSGSTLTLPEQAYRQVQIEHDGRCVATGELVQLGTTLGVQLYQTPQLK